MIKYKHPQYLWGMGVTFIALFSVAARFRTKLSFGYSVIATAGSSDKCAAVEKLGATAVNYREADFAQAVREATQGRGVDVVLEIIGAAYLEKNIESLAMDGRLLLIGFLGGAVAKGFNLSKIMAKRLMVTGSAMRPRTLAEKTEIACELQAQVWPHLGHGLIEPVIHATYWATPLLGVFPQLIISSRGNRLSRIFRLSTKAFVV